MSGLCLATGALIAFLPVHDFTLAWSHSIEKVRWEEDWRIEAGRLHIVEARVRGAGAGMEPPAGALLENGAWRYRPDMPPLERVRLANSDYTADYELCIEGRCRPLAELVAPAKKGQALELYVCKGGNNDGH